MPERLGPRSRERIDFARAELSAVSRRNVIKSMAFAGVGAGVALASRSQPADAFRATANPAGASVFRLYDVTDYGAAGNGTTDDTAAIQAAITAAPVGSVVFFPPGNYRITSTLQGTRSDVSYVGASAFASTILADFSSGDLLNVTGTSNIVVSDLTFEVTSKAQPRTSGYAINHGVVADQSSLRLRALVINNQYSAVNLSGVLDEIIDSVIGSFMHNGIDILGGTDQVVDGVKMPDVANPPNGGGIYLANTGGVLIANSDIINRNNDIWIEASSGGVDSVYSVNNFFDSANYGLLVTGSGGVQRCRFVQCWFCSHASGGIALYNSALENMSFVGCEITGNKSDGVRALAGSLAEFSSCRMAANSGAGITTVPAMSKFRVNGCSFSDPSLGTNEYCVYINGGSYSAYEVTNNFFVDGYSIASLVDGGTTAAGRKSTTPNLG